MTPVILEETLEFDDSIYYFKNTPFFFFFQRLVEAAEDAYLKHEFDADLQVTNNYFL